MCSQRLSCILLLLLLLMMMMVVVVMVVSWPRGFGVVLLVRARVRRRRGQDVLVEAADAARGAVAEHHRVTIAVAGIAHKIDLLLLVISLAVGIVGQVGGLVRDTVRREARGAGTRARTQQQRRTLGVVILLLVLLADELP